MGNQNGFLALVVLEHWRKVLLRNRAQLAKAKTNLWSVWYFLTPEAYLRKFDVCLGSASAKPADAPPCRNYIALMSLAELKALIGKVDDAETKVQLEEAKKNFREGKKPIATLLGTVMGLRKELVKASEKACKELKNAVGQQKPTTKEALGSLCAKKGGSANETALTIFDVVGELGEEIQVVRAPFDVAEEAGYLKPWIFTKDAMGVSLQTAWTTQAQEWESSMSALSLKAEAELAKGNKVRAAEDAPIALAAKWKEVVKTLVPLLSMAEDGSNLAKEGDMLSKTIMPQLFATAPNTCFSQAEKGHLATFRFHAHGVKRVVVVSEAAAYTFMRSKQTGPLTGPTPPFSQIWNAFMQMANDHGQMQQFVSLHGAGKLWYGSVRPEDTLFTPAGTLVIEQVTGAKMGLGVKWHVVTHAEKSVLEGIRSHIVSAPRSTAATLELLAEAIERSSAVEAFVAAQRPTGHEEEKEKERLAHEEEKEKERLAHEEENEKERLAWEQEKERELAAAAPPHALGGTAALKAMQLHVIVQSICGYTHGHTQEKTS
eukprot:2362440-Amphidinium_carterae.2